MEIQEIINSLKMLGYYERYYHPIITFSFQGKNFEAFKQRFPKQTEKNCSFKEFEVFGQCSFMMIWTMFDTYKLCLN